MNKNTTISKTSSVEYLPKTPDHWKVWKISNAFKRVGSGTTPDSGNPAFYDGDIPWVNTSELRESIITDTSAKVTEYALKEYSILTLYPPNTLLIAMYGATIGRLGILGITACTNQACCALAEPIHINSKFCFYWLQSKRNEIIADSSGGGQKNINQEKIRSLRISAPSLHEQKLIADYLDRETTQIDNLIAAKEQMLTLLEEKREALISHAVTRGLDPNVAFKRSGLDWLGDIPQHWQVCQLKRTWESNDYGISENIRGDGEIKVLRMTCIEDGIVDLSKGGEVESVDPYLLLRKGDLLFNRTNSLDQVAKVGIVQSDPEQSTTFASYLVRIRANDLAYPEFLAAYLNSQEFLTFARKNAIAAIGQANLSPSRYGEIKVAIPPKSEQKKIVDIINKEHEKNKELISTLIDSIALLKERRSALITAAVTGQITLEEMTS
jgi:type I restriction enzyme, S subunit